VSSNAVKSLDPRFRGDDAVLRRFRASGNPVSSNVAKSLDPRFRGDDPGP